jgi:hypothetical protein
MREQLTSQQLNGYLDTPAGKALTGQHGGRAQAAAALSAQYQADLTWRRAQAEARVQRHPDRYASTADALRDIPEPLGGSGAWLAGTSDEVVSMLRWADPAWRWRNLGYEDEDTDTHAVASGPGRGLYPADTRPPWQRDRG